LEADFWRFYKIDLIKDAFSRKMSFRRFLIFIRGLPEESAFNCFIRNKDNRNFVEYDEYLIENEIKRIK
jgi:hypothetical protein